MPGAITRVGPTAHNPGDFLPRPEAAHRLEIDPGRFTAAIQLGSQRNFNDDILPELIVKELLDRDVQLIQIDNPLAPPLENEILNVARRSLYPVSEYLGVIDLIITNAGYNSVHEWVYGASRDLRAERVAGDVLPALERAVRLRVGLGLRLRASEFARVRSVVDIAMSEDFRCELRRRSARLEFINGAAEAAEAIESNSSSR